MKSVNKVSNNFLLRLDTNALISSQNHLFSIYSTLNSSNLTKEKHFSIDDEYIIPEKGRSLEEVTDLTISSFSEYQTSSFNKNLRGLGDKSYIDQNCFFGEIFDKIYSTPAFSWDASAAHADSLIILMEKLRKLYNLPDKFAYKDNGIGYISQNFNDSFFIALHDSISRKNSQFEDEIQLTNSTERNFVVYGLPNKEIQKPQKIKNIHNYHFEKFIKSSKDVALDQKDLERSIATDLEIGNTPLIIIYTIRSLEQSLQEVDELTSICTKHGLKLYINGDETGMFSINSVLYQKLSDVTNYITIGMSKISGLTSLLFFSDNRKLLKENLIELTAEYYKSSVAEKQFTEEFITTNKLQLKDYCIGFGLQTSLMKLLFYFESSGINGFYEKLKKLKENTLVIKNCLEKIEKYENIIVFENFVLCDRKNDSNNDLTVSNYNEKFYDSVHQKLDKDYPELFGLYFLEGKSRLLFVASSTENEFNLNFIQKTIESIN